MTQPTKQLTVLERILAVLIEIRDTLLKRFPETVPSPPPAVQPAPPAPQPGPARLTWNISDGQTLAGVINPPPGVRLDGAPGPVTLLVMDVVGKTLWSSSGNLETFITASKSIPWTSGGLENGTYRLRATAGNLQSEISFKVSNPTTQPMPTPALTPPSPSPSQPITAYPQRSGSGIALTTIKTGCRVENDITPEQAINAPHDIIFLYAWQFGGNIATHQWVIEERRKRRKATGLYFDPFVQRADDSILLGKTFDGVTVSMNARYKVVDHGTFGQAIVCNPDDRAWRAAVAYLLELAVKMGYREFKLDDVSILGQKLGPSHDAERRSVSMVRFCRETLDRLTNSTARIWANTGSWTIAACFGPRADIIDDGPSSTSNFQTADRYGYTPLIDVLMRENDIWDHGNPTRPGQQETEDRNYYALYRVLQGKRAFCVLSYPPTESAAINTARALREKGIYNTILLNRPGSSFGWDMKAVLD